MRHHTKAPSTKILGACFLPLASSLLFQIPWGFDKQGVRGRKFLKKLYLAFFILWYYNYLNQSKSGRIISMKKNLKAKIPETICLVFGIAFAIVGLYYYHMQYLCYEYTPLQFILGFVVCLGGALLSIPLNKKADKTILENICQ